jgi:hypothetical protein
MRKLTPKAEAILDLLNTSRLISAEWKLKEESPSGRCSYKFLLPKGWYISFCFENVEEFDLIFREHLFRLKCDGILIDVKRKTFYLAEMKKHLSFPNFVKALNQLKASYFKLLSLLWLIDDFTDYKVSLFIITDFIRKSSLKETYLWKKKALISSQSGDYLYRTFLRLNFFETYRWNLSLPNWDFPVRRDITEKEVSLKILPCGGEGYI